MSWIGATLLPAVAHALRRHHDRPLRPRGPAHLAVLLERQGDVIEAAYVRRSLTSDKGYRDLVTAATNMLREEEQGERGES